MAVGSRCWAKEIGMNSWQLSAKCFVLAGSGKGEISSEVRQQFFFRTVKSNHPLTDAWSTLEILMSHHAKGVVQHVHQPVSNALNIWIDVPGTTQVPNMIRVIFFEGLPSNRYQCPEVFPATDCIFFFPSAVLAWQVGVGSRSCSRQHWVQMHRCHTNYFAHA